MKELKEIHQITIRFNEVDSLGIVWHGHYISYFEEGREAFGKTFGISYLDIKKQGFAVPIVKTSTDHMLPLKYGDVAIIETAFKNTQAAKIIFEYVIKNHQNQVVCKGETVQVFTSIETGEMALTNPEFFKKWKQKYNLLDD
ncbi:acyl-CoA thioesterase [Subsaxibacter sp. CAU 1640]|uniref:acyl-CoA thioesterase n=1 Tax=Subsaxibacter sp. CAU 1640 TaxID=2933271 RepID=UPI00200601FB|nr:acyl-CoA thioesterase [Subsaxibacter sp. CAU 1640]MCK7589449.1 acyl-CoA thioesterase [Subsaxibacter sp. CAU 1640]